MFTTNFTQKFDVFSLVFVILIPVLLPAASGYATTNSTSISAFSGMPAPPTAKIDPDGIQGISRRSLYGQNTNGNFGFSVAGAGDFNGDGYDDAIIGEPNYQSGKGRVYIYFGPVKSNSTVLKLTGETTGDNFGCAVAPAGDINNDGYTDIIIGAKGYSGGTGRAYIFFGGPNSDAIADVIMTGQSAGENFGCSVSGNFDFNKDVYKDVIVGARFNNSNTGKAYVFLGASSPDNSSDLTLTGEATGNNFGCCVAGAGDFNGDGYDDIIVGACGFNSNTGKVYLYLGGVSMNNVSDLTMSGENAGDYFGISVAGAGDVNTDGFNDVIIGASGYLASKGRAYIYKGSAIPDNTVDLVLTGESAGDYFGYSVNTAGDYLIDGYSAVIVGAYGYSSSTGKMYIYLGGVTMNSIADVFVTGDASNNYLGFSVAGMGDGDGDGFPVVIAGAYGNTSGKGAVATIKYSSGDAGDPSLSYSDVTGIQFGSGCSCGDINGDGYDDLILGSSGYSSSKGKIGIYLGGIALKATPDLTITGLSAAELFGATVCIPGDVNGDGYKDFLVAAPNNSTSVGKVYLYYGGSTIDTVPDVTFTGDVASGSFGSNVSSAGDFNNDGYSDFIISFFTSIGKAYLFLGGSVVNTTVDGVFKGTVSTNFGKAMCCAGDINGDGYDDIAISQPNSTKAMLYFGGALVDTAADVTFTETTLTSFGNSIASAGDFNGDGYADLMIGTDAATSNTGRVNIYYGARSINNVADLTMNGEALGNFFGSSMATVGDLNYDGYDDIVIGTYNNPASFGKILTYYGGWNPDNIPDVSRTGVSSASPQSQLGRVIVIGDMNGDKMLDIISATDGAQNAAYLYLSTASMRTTPKLITATDVPFDDGGKITLTWLRCGYDYKNSPVSISNYAVERSPAPDLLGYAWEQIAVVSTYGNSRYSYTLTTPNDSMTGNLGRYYYRITALTGDKDVYFRSNIILGYSKDNLAPSAAKSFGSTIINGVTKLYWSAAREKDFKEFYLYKSASSSINPDSVTPLVITKDTFYLDNSPSKANVYYFLRSADLHGNFSSLSGNSNNPLPVEMDVFYARVNGTSAILHWRTISEVNLSSFSIERKKADEKDWQTIGEQRAAGNSAIPLEYNFTDNKLQTGKYSYRLIINETDGTRTFSNPVSVVIGIPDDFSLQQNFPNPFNPSTVVGFTLPETGDVSVTVFDVLGNKVITLVNERKEAGYYSVQFNATGLNSGTYFCVLNTNGKSIIKKMQLIK